MAFGVVLEPLHTQKDQTDMVKLLRKLVKAFDEPIYRLKITFSRILGAACFEVDTQVSEDRLIEAFDTRLGIVGFDLNQITASPSWLVATRISEHEAEDYHPKDKEFQRSIPSGRRNIVQSKHRRSQDTDIVSPQRSSSHQELQQNPQNSSRKQKRRKNRASSAAADYRGLQNDPMHYSGARNDTSYYKGSQEIIHRKGRARAASMNTYLNRSSSRHSDSQRPFREKQGYLTLSKQSSPDDYYLIPQENLPEHQEREIWEITGTEKIQETMQERRKKKNKPFKRYSDKRVSFSNKQGPQIVPKQYSPGDYLTCPDDEFPEHENRVEYIDTHTAVHGRNGGKKRYHDSAKSLHNRESFTTLNKRDTKPTFCPSEEFSVHEQRDFWGRLVDTKADKGIRRSDSIRKSAPKYVSQELYENTCPSKSRRKGNSGRSSERAQSCQKRHSPQSKNKRVHFDDVSAEECADHERREFLDRLQNESTHSQAYGR